MMEFLGKVVFFSACVLVPTLLLMWVVSRSSKGDDNSDVQE